MNPLTSAITRRGFIGVVAGALAARGETPAMDDAARETFLEKAKVERTKPTAVGITGSKRATLSDGSFTHDAHIQTVDESKQRFETPSGMELNFRDSWKFNVAAYRLDRMLGLGMVPVSVPRHFVGREGSFTWWVDDVLMMDGERVKQKLQAPDRSRWNCQMHMVRIFDQLICNVDRNLQNLLITKSWDVWMIDHTRSFRLHKKIQAPKNVVQCERGLLDKLKGLERSTLRSRLTPFITGSEIDALLGRRDHIVQIVEESVKAQGPEKVLYSFSRLS